VFLDANVLFSAAATRGAVWRLLELLREDGYVCCVDPWVTEEARRNLAGKSPASLPEFEQLIRVLEQLTPVPCDPAFPASLPLPESDRPVLAAAIAGRCDFLVTGDRTYFGALYGKIVRGVKVCSPAGLAEELL
jgi:predicted nucleic acid-binding protein